MFSSKGLQDLLRHAEWADATLWESVLEADSSPLDSKARFWLHHIHLVQHAFARIWRGEPMEFPEMSEFPEAPDLGRWGREAHGKLQEFLSDVSDTDLDRVLEIPWTEELTARFDRPIHDVTLGQSAMQVAMHSTHHRGQVAARLRDLDIEPPMMDFIAWVWFGRPEASWPELG